MSAYELPPEEERVALLGALGELVAARGPQPLVQWPLRRASPDDFPDPWSPDMAGAAGMAKRLLAHAGLGELGFVMEPFGQEEQAQSAIGLRPVEHGHRAAAWFRGIQQGRCWFGVNVTQLRDPESLSAALAHEVAHAYRHHHALMVEDRDLEEQLTDLTTVFLGFGILTTNESDRFRSNFRGWSRSNAGYLSPPSMALLLGAQLVARHAGPRDRRRVRDALERNQAAALDQALRWLEPQEAEIRRQLNVPLEPDPSAFLFSATPAEPFPQDSIREIAQAPREPAAEPVFFVRKHPWSGRAYRMGNFTLLGTFIAFFTQSVWPVGLSMMVAVAYDQWRTSTFRKCSGCMGWLRPSETTCGKCGGFVVGEIERRRDHYEAVADYWKAQGLPEDDPLEEDEDLDMVQ